MSDTLNERSCTIPEVFSQITGYDKPEIHKLRKRACQSMSKELLLSHSQALSMAFKPLLVKGNVA